MNIVSSILDISVIKECFDTDVELCSKFHISAPADSEICALRTVMDLKSTPFEYNFYKIEKDGKLVGWFGDEGGFALTGFFIKPEYRNKSVEIFELMTKGFKKEFICGVYDKNIRAIKFLKKLGGIEYIKTENGMFFRFGEK